MSNHKKIRVVFMGTPEFSLPGLKALLKTPDFEVVGIFTQPDKPVGRSQLLTPPPIKILAEKNNLLVFQPGKIKTEAENIKKLNPDLIVVIAYGKIIPEEILDLPAFGCVNVHASLLPKYRGAACLNAPILNNDAETGITIMKMDAGLDTGPILRQAKIKLSGNESLEDVHDQLAALGAELLIPTLLDFIVGKTKPVAQNENEASYVKTLKKEDGKIDWKKSAAEIERMFRAYSPWPGTYSYYSSTGADKIIKILAVEHDSLNLNNHEKGEIFLHDQKLMIQCGQDSLVILKLQLEGKRALSAAEFLRGNSGFIGQKLK